MSEGLFFPQQTTSGITLTVIDTQFILTDDADTTKRARFECTAITAGQTRIFAFPDATDTIVGVSSIQTLIGKSMSGASNIFTSINGTSSLINNSVNWQAVATGAVVQVVNTQTGAVNTGSTVLPFDDTIPQNTEGDQYMSLAITPLATTNKLRITVVFDGAVNGNLSYTIALFQDATASAIAAIGCVCIAAGNMTSSTLVHYMDAGTTSATTFKVRAGVASAGQITFNGAATARRFGGVCASSITIEEIKV